MQVTAVNVPAAQDVVIISEDWAAVPNRPTLPAPKPGAPEAPAKPVELTDKRISQAVGETLKAAPEKTDAPANQQEALRGQVLSGDKYQTFTKEFAYAKVPYCLGQDALKFQPPKIGPIVFGGLLALPFMVVAKVRGKCK